MKKWEATEQLIANLKFFNASSDPLDLCAIGMSCAN
jgi:hypothetical protein